MAKPVTFSCLRRLTSQVPQATSTGPLSGEQSTESPLPTAKKHPERLCVVETASSASPRREFTYRQIDEASNILAHHLVQSGIQRNEVVMSYSHGASTWSQIIYLDVARPRAQVVIDKATKEAGKLSDKVRSFISGTLDLRTEVPALELKDDGTLLGGSIDGKAILADQVAAKENGPGVVVGPDSHPTLSFTSGSEGRPKGVRGRHFSLAYYFDWRSERFRLTANDKFTMLSGIAHDPIQRDIFTPLFLGAQILRGHPAREARRMDAGAWCHSNTPDACDGPDPRGRG
ncbi:hypothetical protein DL766_005694 [Monosporascus sp. MC13-8B]|uniref:AMP-dependent synthetase/ligase domain-containing protein n=1 Tax=Monosporascus cannonballus TaxID=155416 RepID=A0ABY0HGV3_9PEZI|nr:hypothetical protein DL762_001286 [Monosporascus cannonballus]RYO99720.1 hypothetical protein DL763_001328 [Monosporascus cannonballus]RYP28780.1 hypothetical protein DL766_005694 [Monosporascus sp. MC13-8B]